MSADVPADNARGEWATTDYLEWPEPGRVPGAPPLREALRASPDGLAD